MKTKQLCDHHGGYSDMRLWPFYLLYSGLSLMAVMGTHGQEWLVVINAVALFVVIMVARWENKTFRYDVKFVGPNYETVMTRTRIVPKPVKVARPTGQSRKPRQTMTGSPRHAV